MIRVQNLNKTYGRRRHNGENRVLKDVSFSLPSKGFVCILGPSGCGKTSLLNAVGGLDRFDSGSLSTENVKVQRYGTRAYEMERDRNFGYIFQNYYLLENHSAAYNVYLGLHSLRLSHAEKLQRVRQALAAVDMERFIHRTVGELSGGQQQRVAIARALARRPRVIFADEPTGNLDEANTRNICTLLRQASKESLVIMVTHEERIARFFADRIITLRDGKIASDDQSWERENLEIDHDQAVYTKGLDDARAVEGCVKLRLLQEPGADPADVTVAVLKDRIVIKLADSRNIQLGGPEEAPKIIKGTAPVLTLEEVDRQNQSQTDLFRDKPAPPAPPGKGVTLPMMFREARNLKKGKRIRRVGIKLFLVVLTALTLWMVGDYLALSKVDPEDFITTDSHVLRLTLAQGKNLDAEGYNPDDPESVVTQMNRTPDEIRQQYLEDLRNTDLDLLFLPSVPEPPTIGVRTFFQLERSTIRVPELSYIHLDRLDPSTLIYGRMPQNREEIVVDRLVLEAILENDGLVQNYLTDVSYFLDNQFAYPKRNFYATIVGICDSGERSVYMGMSAMASICASGGNVITLSEFQAQYPGKYEDFTLEDDECFVNLPSAGRIYRNHKGRTYSFGDNKFEIKDFVEEEELSAFLVIPDSRAETMVYNSALINSNSQVQIYCADKQAVKAHLARKTPDQEAGYLTVSVRDVYQEQMDSYTQAAQLRADARTIVTFTVIALCLVMLYLLCRTQAQSRLELLAVYRLLGIPRRKLHGIFLMESLFAALETVLPTAVLLYAGVTLANGTKELALPIELPWQAALAVGLAICGYYLLVTALPLVRLLGMPPAQLAAKYDI